MLRTAISANSVEGVLIGGGFGPVTGTLVEGNYIGTDASGSNALGNSVGVVIANGSTSTIIGGITSGARNIISGNMNQGVEITDAGTALNVVEGDYISTDITGSHALSNVVGVWIQSCTNNTVGGTVTAARDVISANTADGVQIDYSGTTGNVVERDYTGSDATGAFPLGNGRAGVYSGRGSQTTSSVGRLPGHVISSRPTASTA